MRLQVVTPVKRVVDEEAAKVTAESEGGAFCLLPRHQDLAAALVPGLMHFVDADGREVFLAVNEGILVKSGRDVLVSSRQAVRGPDLPGLRRVVDEEFLVLDEKEKKARTVVTKIEVSFVRRFLEMNKYG
jgi:F-type H+-transporting ATPase subunit epsilon